MIDLYRRQLIEKLRSVMIHAPLCKAAAEEMEDLMYENKLLLKELGDTLRSKLEKKHD